VRFHGIIATLFLSFKKKDRVSLFLRAQERAFLLARAVVAEGLAPEPKILRQKEAYIWHKSE